MTPDTTKLQQVLDGLMRRYVERVPDVPRVIEALVGEKVIEKKEDIENDHIAFRTLGMPHLGIQSLEKIFLHFGYTKKERYNFVEKKLTAYWYAPPASHLPRIFISELNVDQLSAGTQAILQRYAGTVASDPVDALDLNDPQQVDHFLHSSLWAAPTYGEYKALLAESEYAAWVIYNRYYLNHFTISVHNLPAGYNTIETFNAFLLRQGFKLNDAGGLFKKSPDGLLLQSSTVSQMVPAQFAGGEEHPIAGSYVEFAERKVLPQFAGLPPEKITREHRREGFEAANADKIFESTYTTQVLK